MGPGSDSFHSLQDVSDFPKKGGQRFVRGTPGDFGGRLSRAVKNLIPPSQDSRAEVPGVQDARETKISSLIRCCTARRFKPQ